MYKTINGWTKEKMIEQIKLRNNGTKSVDRIVGGCFYRGINNNCCAVGCFIPDEEYKYSFDVARSFYEVYSQLKRFMPLNFNGMCNMREVHDNFEGEDMHVVLENWINENVQDN